MNKSCSRLVNPFNFRNKALFCKMHSLFRLLRKQKLRRPFLKIYARFCFSKKAFSNKQHVLCDLYYTTTISICQHILWYIFAPTLDFLHVL